MRPGYGGRMELRHLRYFVAVAEELNFTHAAARLRVAQPALEPPDEGPRGCELQTPLFERGHTGVQLTRAGASSPAGASSILAQATEAANEARAAAGAITGSLVLGFPQRPPPQLPRAGHQAFKRIHPQVQFDYFHGLPGEQFKALREGRIDLAFVNLPVPLDGLNTSVIWRVPFKVVLPQRHPLARRSAMELGDLRSEDFVFCTREPGPSSTTSSSACARMPGFVPASSRRWGVIRPTCWASSRWAWA
jgi:DNA-binding transcriptional LysR family regulator